MNNSRAKLGEFGGDEMGSSLQPTHLGSGRNRGTKRSFLVIRLVMQQLLNLQLRTARTAATVVRHPADR